MQVVDASSGDLSEILNYHCQKKTTHSQLFTPLSSPLETIKVSILHHTTSDYKNNKTSTSGITYFIFFVKIVPLFLVFNYLKRIVDFSYEEYFIYVRFMQAKVMKKVDPLSIWVRNSRYFEENHPKSGKFIIRQKAEIEFAT